MHVNVPDDGAKDLAPAESRWFPSNQEDHVADGIVVVQNLTKNKLNMATVKDVSDCFIDNRMELTRGHDEIMLVFDTYKVN